MTTARIWSFGIVILALALWIGTTGCGQQQQSQTPSGPGASGGPAPAGTSAGADHGDHGHEGHHDHEHDSEEIKTNLAKLSDEDRKLAEAQKVCPVSDEPLGSMGVPQKLTVKGKTVFICCEGCREKLEADPDKYLAKIKQ